VAKEKLAFRGIKPSEVNFHSTLSREHFLYDNVGGRADVFEILLLFYYPIIRNFKIII
jgi:hypothetical protein